MSELSVTGALHPAVLEDRLGVQKQAKASLNEEERARLKTAAREFEALFLGLMLKEMRATVDSSDLGEKGLGQGTYTEMFDQEVARSLSARGALGIADLLLRNLSHPAQVPDENAGGRDEAVKGSPPASK
jgi:peptidoglycan hydrolase FlgJ